MFKHSSNAFEIAFWGVLITLIIGVNPKDGGKLIFIIGFAITGALVLLCLNGGSTHLPTYSKMKGDGTLWWYENSKNWTQKINGIEMTYDQYLNIFDENAWGTKSIIDYEKRKESLDREHNYYYDTFPEEEKVHWNQKNLYGRFLKIHKTPNGLYRDDYGTYRPIGQTQKGFEVGRKYVNGEVKMCRHGYLKPEYENNPLFFHPKVDEMEEMYEYLIK